MILLALMNGKAPADNYLHFLKATVTLEQIHCHNRCSWEASMNLLSVTTLVGLPDNAGRLPFTQSFPPFPGPADRFTKSLIKNKTKKNQQQGLQNLPRKFSMCFFLTLLHYASFSLWNWCNPSQPFVGKNFIEWTMKSQNTLDWQD